MRSSARFLVLSWCFFAFSAFAFDTDLVVVRIVTENKAPIYDQEKYVNAKIEIQPQAGGNPAFAYKGDLQIKGHGNSTWGMPKRPYRLKLKDKISVLGMPKDKDFLLLANYTDKTLLRNDVSFEISRRFGLAYTPRSESVELFLNDQYIGVYLLVEKIELGKSRVDITEMTPTDVSGDAVSGGYLLEIDHKRRWDEVGFDSKKGVMFTIKEPGDKIKQEQINYIRDYVQKAEDALFSADFKDPMKGYAAYFDVDALVNWYLVNELTKNNDAVFWTSVYLYKDRGGKLTFGPAWDFDIAIGNCNYNDMDKPSGWWIRKASWYEQLFTDPAFSAKVAVRWKQLKATQIDTMLTYIDAQAKKLDRGQKNNFAAWPILNQYVWPNAEVAGSYKGEIDYLKSYFTKRMNWMDGELK